MHARREICGYTYLAEHLFWHLGSMGGTPDESRLVGNKEDKEMFEKEIDEIYGLCKRVVNEVPAANITTRPFSRWRMARRRM